MKIINKIKNSVLMFFLRMFQCVRVYFLFNIFCNNQLYVAEKMDRGKRIFI